eukprot:300509-Amphidinium_carterae.1
MSSQNESLRWERSGDCPKFEQTLCCWWRKLSKPHFPLSYGKQLGLASAGVEKDEEGQHELGDVEPELGGVEEEELEEKVEDAWVAEAKSKDTRTLSRFVALRLVYGSARGSDFAAAASSTQ